MNVWQKPSKKIYYVAGDDINQEKFTMNNRIITVASYGLCLFSITKLNSFLKENKIKSKKLLKYFQDDKNIYLKSIEEGAWLPILPIDAINYEIKFVNSNESFDTDWIIFNQNNGFNIDVEKDNTLWIASIGILLNWDPSLFEKNFNGNISYQTLDGVDLYQAFQLPCAANKYIVDIVGYKREKELEYPNVNTGYQFKLTPTLKFADALDPREDDKYTFKIR